MAMYVGGDPAMQGRIGPYYESIAGVDPRGYARASLWFVYAVQQYYKVTGDAALIHELRPALQEIIA
ncbi:MAG: amylo-alpha-1,6-glucosidase, partial [Deltaproteobacteria bacterium]